MYYFILIIILTLFWGFFIEPNIIVVNKFNFKNSKLKGLKCVLIGDLHIRPKQDKKLKKIVDIIVKQKADILFIVGDFVNGIKKEQTMPIEKIVSELNKINTKYGKFVVLGNHDYFHDFQHIIFTLKKASFTVLRNENVCINYNKIKLYIAGVDDYRSYLSDTNKALLNTKEPTILLTHSPDIFDEVKQKTELILAGHTHGKQINLPFIRFIINPSDFKDRFLKKYINENGKKMIVTNGIGESKLYFRLNCFPEIITINYN